MFLCGTSKAHEVVSIVQETLLCPDKHIIGTGGKHVAKKTFPYDVGEFVEFDEAGNLCTRLLNIVKVSGFYNQQAWKNTCYFSISHI